MYFPALVTRHVRTSSMHLTCNICFIIRIFDVYYIKVINCYVANSSKIQNYYQRDYIVAISKSAY